MSVSRNVTVPVGNREPGPPSALLGNAASAHIGDLPCSIMARPSLGPGSAAYICQMAYLHGGPASVTSCDGLSRRTTAPIPKQVSKRGQRACPEICQRRDVAPAPAAGAVASLAADHVLAPARERIIPAAPDAWSADRCRREPAGRARFSGSSEGTVSRSVKDCWNSERHSAAGVKRSRLEQLATRAACR